MLSCSKNIVKPHDFSLQERRQLFKIYNISTNYNSHGIYIKFKTLIISLWLNGETFTTCYVNKEK